ncbi:hypothetical protein CBL_00254 [Carabus blaptoides fortunei]
MKEDAMGMTDIQKGNGNRDPDSVARVSSLGCVYNKQLRDEKGQTPQRCPGKRPQALSRATVMKCKESKVRTKGIQVYQSEATVHIDSFHYEAVSEIRTNRQHLADKHTLTLLTLDVD